jgi:2-amino-4-hydroxy-6-hydroxymethyldihydropteridine diphosphokinase
VARIFLSLGSNLTNREENIRRATGLLNHNDIRLTRISPIYQTAPVGATSLLGLGIVFGIKQPNFLNCVLEASTDYAPNQLLRTVLKIEKILGRRRVPGMTNLARKIDIDILFYDDMIINQSMLKIPHPRLHERAFVLIPLCDLEPNLVHPVLNKTVKDLLNSISKNGVALWQGQDSKILA